MASCLGGEKLIDSQEYLDLNQLIADVFEGRAPYCTVGRICNFVSLIAYFCLVLVLMRSDKGL